MSLFEFEGSRPEIHDTAFIAPTATIIGDVTVEEGASVWYGAVIRADYASVIIRAGANVQDGSVVHSPPDMPVDVGRGATIAHNCVVHGATLGDESLIANGVIVLDGSSIGARSLVAAGSVVTPGTHIPDGVLAFGTPARVKGPLEGTGAEFWVKLNPPAYQELARRHREGIRPIEPNPA